jgi:hypothetical protein
LAIAVWCVCNVAARGDAQAINFPPAGDLRAGAAPVKLNAKSDANLPVEYYVAYGPAVIEDGQLKIVEIPRRVRYPIAVKVVAYQFGSAREPLFKTAAPVEQTLMVTER